MNREEVIALSNSYSTPAERNRLKEYFSDINRLVTNKRTIVFSTPSETGTSFFRVLEPLLSIYRATDDYNLLYTEALDPRMFEVADLIVLHRAGDKHDWFHTVQEKYMRDKVKPIIVHNVDDNEFNLPASHPMREMWLATGKDKMSLRSLIKSAFIETTTLKLASTFKTMNKNVEIRRNRFNWRLPQWNLDNTEKVEKFGNKFVIGWAGLTSHYNDLVKMQPILKEIQGKYPNVHIVLAGMAIKDTVFTIEIDPNTGQKVMKESDLPPGAKTYRQKVEELFADLDQDRLTIETAVGLEDYGRFYSWFDLGISYIEHNTFNSCKSEIKSVEYAKYGGIPIMSYFGGYKDFLDIHDNEYKDNKLKDVLGCTTEQASEWISKISKIIDLYNNDINKYNELSKHLKAFVEDYYDIDKFINEQIGFYNRLIEENREKEIHRITQLRYS